MKLIVDNSVGELENHPVYWYTDKTFKKDLKLVNYTSNKLFNSLSDNRVDTILVLCKEALNIVESYYSIKGKLYQGNVTYGNLIGCSYIHNNIHIICLPTIGLINSSRVGKFLLTRLLQKFSNPDSFMPDIRKRYSHVAKQNSNEYNNALALLMGTHYTGFVPKFMTVDLETLPEVGYKLGDETRYVSAVINVVGWSIVGTVEGLDSARSHVIYTFTSDFTHKWHYDLVKTILESDVPKVFSNGMYDASYFYRWRIVPKNYMWDTEYWLRSTVPEFSGYFNLQSQSTLYTLTSQYWKTGLDAKTRKEFLEYCGNDCHNTAVIALAQITSISKQNFRNFIIGFSRIPYCLASTLTGMPVNETKIDDLRKEYSDKVFKLDEKARRVFGCKPSQDQKIKEALQKLCNMLHKLDVMPKTVITSTGKEVLRDLSYKSPILAHYIKIITEYRRNTKWLETYINVKLFSKTDNGAKISEPSEKLFLWTLFPFGTKSGRMSSKGSPFWCGNSAHTLPKEMRKMFKAPKNSVLFSTDAPQSETRVTAYAAQCETLRARVEGELDFHMLQASAFFGILYEEVTDDLRNIGKRVNHGANYNMGDYVMLITMGIELVMQARSLLKLDHLQKLTQVTAYLLNQFAKAYPEVKIDWVIKLVQEVLLTGRIMCTVSGYAPLILGDPIRLKSDLNNIISIIPQSTSAYISIKASIRLFNAWLYDKSGVFPLLQIHDENVCTCNQDMSMVYVDGLVEKLCSNAYKMRWGIDYKTMVIPVGEVVVGKTWDALKAKPKKRVDNLEEIKHYA